MLNSSYGLIFGLIRALYGQHVGSFYLAVLTIEKVKVIGALDRYSSLSMAVYKGPGSQIESVALRQSWYQDPAMKLTS